MSIGTISSTGKQNAAVAGGLKYKKLKKGESSFCFLGDDSVVDFASLINFIVNNGGSSIDTNTSVAPPVQSKRTAIPVARGYMGGGSYVSSYTSFIVTQAFNNTTGEWSTPSSIVAVGYHSTSGNPFDYVTLDNSWTVV